MQSTHFGIAMLCKRIIDSQISKPLLITGDNRVSCSVHKTAMLQLVAAIFIVITVLGQSGFKRFHMALNSGEMKRWEPKFCMLFGIEAKVCKQNEKIMITAANYGQINYCYV